MDPAELQDCILGQNNWLNIQLVLRSTFHLFHDTLVVQQDQIRQLEKMIQRQAEESTSMREEIMGQRQIIRNLETQVTESVPRRWDAISSDLVSLRKAVQDRIDKIQASIDTKLTAEVFRSTLDERDRNLRTSMSSALASQFDQIASIVKSKIDKTEVDHMISVMEDRERASRTSAAANINTQIESIVVGIRNKVEREEIDDRLHKLEQLLAERFGVIRSSSENLHRGVRQLQMKRAVQTTSPSSLNRSRKSYG
eukprot:ANDGO_04871.mRNA.1 hypothetical protein